MTRALSALSDDLDGATEPPSAAAGPLPGPAQEEQGDSDDESILATVASNDEARTARPQLHSSAYLPPIIAPTEAGEVALGSGADWAPVGGPVLLEEDDVESAIESFVEEAPDVDIDDDEVDEHSLAEDEYHVETLALLPDERRPHVSQTSEHASASPELTRLRVEREILLRHMMRANRRLAERVEEQTAALREQSQHLAAANRAKDILLARTGHDVRNGVGVVLAYSSMLSPGLDAEKVDFVKAMEGACRHLIDLLDDLVDDAALASGTWSLRPGEFVVEDLLEGVCAQLRDGPYRRKKQTLLMLRDGGPHRVLADSKRVGQVVRNYLDNAGKYSPPSTEVQLLVRSEGSDLIVEVSDHGPGIPVAAIPRLFEASADIGNRPTGGERSTGIGLSIVADIVKRHGGRCWGTNREGGGSVFGFAIPKDGPPPAAPTPPATKAKE